MLSGLSKVAPMAITIRNKATQELIRTIGRRTGEGPGVVVRRLAIAEAAKSNAPEVSEEESRRRIARFEEIARLYPPPEPRRSWGEIQAETDALHDYLDESKSNLHRRTGS